MTTVHDKEASPTTNTALVNVSRDHATTGDRAQPNNPLSPVTKSPQPSAAIMTALALLGPEIFKRARDLRVLCAIFLGFARMWELHIAAGYATLEEYAAAKFELTAPSFKQLLRAATGVWKFFPDESQKVIDWMGHQVEGASLSDIAGISVLPPVSTLRELEAAMDRVTDQDDQGVLLEKVKTGKVSHRDLREVGRTKPGTAAGARDVLVDTASEGLATPNTNDDSKGATSTAKEGSALLIFQDVEELEGAASLVHDAATVLAGVHDCWGENPSADVTPVRPILRKLMEKLGEIENTLTEHVVPRTHCGNCRGRKSGKPCTKCGGLGWLPRKPMFGKSQARGSVKKPKATGAAKGTKAKTTGAKPGAAPVRKGPKAAKRGK